MNQRIGVVELVNDDWLRYSQLTTITLIGSTRFKSRFLELSKNLEFAGNNVLHTHIFSHADEYEINDEQLKVAHQNGHNRIDMSDQVIVIAPDLKIGDNTLEEIEYADSKGKCIQLAPIKIGVHNGIFHADDIISCALIIRKLNNIFSKSYVLKKYFRFVPVQIIRTRDQNILNTCDWVCDVGFEDLIDEKNARYCFDHHQKDSGYYPNGIKMAACGKLANYLFKENKELLKYLQENILFAIEAQDNGQNIAEFGKYPNPVSFIKLMNNNWNEEDFFDMFETTIRMTYVILERIIDKFFAQFEGKQTMINYINNYCYNSSNHILVMDQFVPWQESIINYNAENNENKIYIVIFPAIDDGYTCQVVPKELNSFDSFVSFPKEWRSLQNNALEKASGIKGAKFCHAAGFLSSWKTLKGAISAAEIAVK